MGLWWVAAYACGVYPPPDSTGHEPHVFPSLNSGCGRIMKILIVEDSRALAMSLQTRLHGFGHDTEVARNGVVGVEAFAKNDYDLVLMDIEMPEMNGFEAATRIRAMESTQSGAWTPIIFLTASDNVDNLVTAIHSGGDDFISKNAAAPVLQAKMKAMSRIAALRAQIAQANAKLEAIATRDGLTGLCNRQFMNSRTDDAWSNAISSGSDFGLIMIDVDNFKKYNDTYGHLKGDDCLSDIAATLDEITKKVAATEGAGDVFAARYGGEEFAVVLPNIDRNRTIALAQELVGAVRGLGIVHEQNAEWGVATISVGVAHLSPPSGRIADIFRSADAAMYSAKDQGRNRVGVAQTMDEVAVENVRSIHAV